MQLIIPHKIKTSFDDANELELNMDLKVKNTQENVRMIIKRPSSSNHLNSLKFTILRALEKEYIFLYLLVIIL